MNSAPSVAALYYSSAGVQTQRYHAADAEKVAIEPYTGTKVQQELAELSKKCHAAARFEDVVSLSELEREVDAKSAEYWGIKTQELEGIRKAIAVILNAGEPLTDSDSEAE